MDEIYITHMHGDHVGGLMAADKLAFPNAIVRADQRDADYWLPQANLDAAPDAAKNAVQRRDGVDQSVRRGRQIQAVRRQRRSHPRHHGRLHVRPHGATRLRRREQGAKIAVLGDLMHVAAVQFPDPSVTIRFDTDPKTAAVQRKKTYADSAKQGFWIAVAHLPFPGIGHIRAEGKGTSTIRSTTRFRGRRPMRGKFAP